MSEMAGAGCASDGVGVSFIGWVGLLLENEFDPISLFGADLTCVV